MAKHESTSSDGDSITCPVCGYKFSDLWDHDFESRECLEMECEGCEAPITLCQSVNVSYTCYAGHGA